LIHRCAYSPTGIVPASGSIQVPWTIAASASESHISGEVLHPGPEAESGSQRRPGGTSPSGEVSSTSQFPDGRPGLCRGAVLPQLPGPRPHSVPLTLGVPHPGAGRRDPCLTGIPSSTRLCVADGPPVVRRQVGPATGTHQERRDTSCAREVATGGAIDDVRQPRCRSMPVRGLPVSTLLLLRPQEPISPLGL
jgi:hypothetical protein